MNRKLTMKVWAGNGHEFYTLDFTGRLFYGSDIRHAARLLSQRGELYGTHVFYGDDMIYLVDNIAGDFYDKRYHAELWSEINDQYPDSLAPDLI